MEASRPFDTATVTTGEDCTMIPLLPHELLMTAVEMVCYFFTAVGVAFTFLFAPRT